MKKWYQSKTIQVAIIQGVMGIVTAFIAVNPAMKDIGFVVIVKSILDLLLRVATTKGIE